MDMPARPPVRRESMSGVEAADEESGWLPSTSVQELGYKDEVFKLLQQQRRCPRRDAGDATRAHTRV